MFIITIIKTETTQVTLLITGKRENASLNGVETTGYLQGKKQD